MKELYGKIFREFSENNELAAMAHFVAIKGKCYEENDIRLMIIGRAPNGWLQFSDYSNETSFGTIAESQFWATDRMTHANGDIIQDDVKIACFTETPTNLPMWTLYGKEHTGICLEYNITQLENVDRLLPVVYCDVLPNGANITINNQLGQYLFLSLASIQKHYDWRYEQEWRLVYKTSDWYKERKDAPQSFIESGQLIYFMKPSRVLLGRNISHNNEQIIQKWCQKCNITVQKMTCTEYGLEPK